MQKKFLSAKEIAEQLGVMSTSGKPHSRVITEVLRKLGIGVQVKNHIRVYPADSKWMIRKWLHEEGLPEELLIESGKMITVQYVPCRGGKPVYEDAV